MYKKCQFFDSCNAPLCPLDEQSVKRGCWFPGEEICRQLHHPAWVTRQYKVARKLPHDMESGCFTVRMLQRNCRINTGTRGVDPDKGPAHEQEDAWLKEHPELVPTKAQRKHLEKLHGVGV